jgi:hypothetical protein
MCESLSRIAFQRVTATSDVVLPSRALKSVQVWSKLTCNEEHFSLETERVSRPYLVYHSSGVTETPHVALSAHVVQSLQVWWNSVSNEGHIIPEAETDSALSGLILLWCE